MLTLYTYFRSSAAYRVRIALGLKGLAYTPAFVHLARGGADGGGQQHDATYRAINPAGRVPALALDGDVITQSQAIIEFVDESWPQPPLLPADARGRARVRALSATIACDIHPLNNTSVLARLKTQFGADDDAVNAWYRHWVENGLTAFEALLADGGSGDFCHGDTPGMADCFLVPQVFNARRFQCDIAHLARIQSICQRCEALPAFAQAAPSAQADAE